MRNSALEVILSRRALSYNKYHALVYQLKVNWKFLKDSKEFGFWWRGRDAATLAIGFFQNIVHARCLF